MKLMALFLFILTVQVRATSHAQKVSLRFNNAPLKTIFTSIEKQTGYSFIYRQDLLGDLKKPVTIRVENESLATALQLLFRSQPVSYQVVEKYIIVKPANKVAEPSQDKPVLMDVTGRVVYDSGEPAVVTVTVKGTKKGAVTDANGKFLLTDVAPDATLVIAGINIETVEIKVNGQTDLGNIQVKLKATDEEEILLNTGYQKLKPNEVVGSYEKVDNALFNRTVTPNVLERLEGIVPGLIFNKLIGTDNKTDISIRGISTINSDQKPLIIVDDFPYEGDINNINPNDVENITILKDAAAASIWGTKAGNGVIVITTKKGKYNKPATLSLTSNITVIDKPDLYYIPQMPSGDFIEMERFLFDKGYYNSKLNSTTTYPVVSPAVEILNNLRRGAITQQEADAQLNTLKSHDVRKDYLKYLYRKTTNLQNALSLTGGNQAINYLLSAGYDKNLSTYVGDDQQRITIKSLVNTRPVKNLELQMGTTLTLGQSHANSIGGSVSSTGTSSAPPYTRLADDNGNALAFAKDRRLGFTDTAGGGKLLDWTYRPLDEMKWNDNTGKLQDLLLNLGARYSFTPWLSVDVKYQFERQVTSTRNYYSVESYTTRDLINQYTPKGGSALLNSAIPYGGILSSRSSSLTAHALRGQLNFNKSFGLKHTVNAIIGSELRESNATSEERRVYGYDDNVLTYRNVDPLNNYPLYVGGSAKVPNNLYLSDILNRFASFYGNLAYTYNKKYSLFLSGRRDASNLFGTASNNKWKPLWSAGAGWSLSEEPFYHFSLLPLLKLRATYGYSGNVNNSVAGILTLRAGSANDLTNLATMTVNNPPNPNLRWENVAMWNIGIDFATRNNKLKGSLEYYRKRSTDLITDIPADLTTGFVLLTVNSAILKGKGIDISLNSINIDGPFRWETNLLFSHNKDKIAKYLLKPSSVISYVRGGALTPIEGQTAYSIFSWAWAGLDSVGDPQGYLNGAASKDYNAIMNNPQITGIVYNGSARPQYFGALRNTFTYKRISLSANITYRLSYYFRNPYALRYTYLYGGELTAYTEYQKRWQQPGDELHTSIPSMIYPAVGNRDNFYAQSTLTALKGDHIRFNDVNIGYDIINHSSKRLPIKSARLFVYINNIGLLWTANKKGIDPDYGTPPAKSYAMGINVSF